MKIMIVGNMGYVGSVLSNHLGEAKSDWEISGFDNAYFAHGLLPGNHLPERNLVNQEFGDVRDITPERFKGVDAVVYLSAISNDPMGNVFAKPTYEINEDSAIATAEMSKKAGVKSYVFASSCSVYGTAGDGKRTEESELNPLTPYAKSKINSENRLKEYGDSNFSVTCLRFATACGFSPRLRLDLVLNDFVANAMMFNEIKILSDGSPWRPLIHVKDMARAIEWAVQRTDSPYLALNAGSDQWNYQIKDLATAVSDVLGGVDVSINKDAEPDKRSYQVNFSKFKEMAPNHQPQVSLEAAISDLKEGLAAAKFDDKDFRNSDLIRLRVLEGLIEKRVLDTSLRYQRG